MSDNYLRSSTRLLGVGNIMFKCSEGFAYDGFRGGQRGHITSLAAGTPNAVNTTGPINELNKEGEYMP